MTVLARMREFGISTRTRAAAGMTYAKFSFSNDFFEKGYLTGFRLGDLNVYMVSDKSETIVVRCNTTQEVQIELMRLLFSKYGQVTASTGLHSTNINCFLNNSFNFLLPKYMKVPSWVTKEKKVSLAFIAGYTDAEGSFKLNQGKARFKIDSYDYDILNWITDWLLKQKINVKFRRIAKRGEPRYDGKFFNKDLWRLTINEAQSLLQFTAWIKPFVKHKQRLYDMNLCRDNILKRIQAGTVKYAIKY